MILAFHNQDIEVKGILVFFMVFLYGLMIKIFQPYKIQKHNEIDLLATYCVGLSLVLGVFIYKNEFTPWVIFGLIIICNFLIIIINIIIIIIIGVWLCLGDKIWLRALPYIDTSNLITPYLLLLLLLQLFLIIRVILLIFRKRGIFENLIWI